MTEIKELNEIAPHAVPQVPWETDCDNTIYCRDPRFPKPIRIPRRKITKIQALVAERWVANVCVPKHVCEHLIEAPFLEPIYVNNHAVVSLCAIFMKHAAPPWMPLKWGPGSHNCALRVACRDKRDGTQAVWVDYRYTDSPYAALVAYMGFPPLIPQLEIHRWHDRNGDQTGLILDTINGALRLEIEGGYERRPAMLFADAQAFTDYFCAGIRSYGPGPDDRFAVVDLEKRQEVCFEALDTWRGILHTNLGRWFCDGIYRTTHNYYDWTFYGYCNANGEMN